MKRILLSILLFLLQIHSFSKAEIQVIQVKRNITLSDDEPVYKDYYLSGGSKNGLRVNLVVPVLRWINLRENNQSQDQSLKIIEPVAWLKIIYVQDQLAVARLYESANYMNQPILEQPGIMMGDLIQLENSFMSKPNKKLPRDSHQVSEVTSNDAKSTALENNVALKSSVPSGEQTQALQASLLQKSTPVEESTEVIDLAKENRRAPSGEPQKTSDSGVTPIKETLQNGSSEKENLQKESSDKESPALDSDKAI